MRYSILHNPLLWGVIVVLFCSVVLANQSQTQTQSQGAAVAQPGVGSGATPAFSDAAPNASSDGQTVKPRTGFGNSYPANSLRNAPNTSATGSLGHSSASAGSQAIEGTMRGQGSAQINNQMFNGSTTQGQNPANLGRLGRQPTGRLNAAPGTFGNNTNFYGPTAQRWSYAPNIPNNYSNVPLNQNQGLNTSMPGQDPNTPLQPSPNDLNAWRFANHNGSWWYWMPGDYWMTWNGTAWNRYVPNTAPNSVNQPAVGP